MLSIPKSSSVGPEYRRADRHRIRIARATWRRISWYEFYPHFSNLIDLRFPVGTGDVMSAEVSGSQVGPGVVFTVLLTDQTISKSFGTPRG